MTEPRRRILVVDDTPLNVKLLVDLLGVSGYEVASADGGALALTMIAAQQPDLVLLDVMMPGMNGYEVCEKLRADPATALLPIVLVTALDGKEDRVRGIEAGADDFLTKPVNKHEMLARVKSLLRIRTLHEEVAQQRTELQAWNLQLEERVQEGVTQVQRLSTLKRYFSPAVADLIVEGKIDPLKTHRSEITVVFLDLRGFTAFTESTDPEDVITVLREYHRNVGELIVKHEGTVEHFAGDGIMIFFNDPIPVANAARSAVQMALEMHAVFAACSARWARLGHRLGLGIGIAQGFATMGVVGFEGRYDYGAIGGVCNLSARLCSDAGAGQTLVQQRVVGRLEGEVDAESIGTLELKGFPRPVEAFNVRGMKSAGTAQATAAP